MQGNIWNEYMQSDERRDYQAFPRAVALAETGWTQNNRKNWNSFRSRMVEDFERMDAMNVKACRNFFDVNINTHVYDGTLKAVLETFYPDAKSDIPQMEVHRLQSLNFTLSHSLGKVTLICRQQLSKTVKCWGK